ncbi:ion channel [Bacteriovoracaceae bacterium]|nr:ion channel [Bacteriovoracaceae bacterium]
MSWGSLIICLGLYFLTINIIFTALYLFLPTEFSVSNLSVTELFYFSTHTYSTVGYGNISPANHISNILVVIEIFIGIISTALMTGLVFSKFSRPKSFIDFSTSLLISKFRGKRSLIFRTINDRFANVINLEVSMSCLIDELTDEGQHFRKVILLELEKPFLPMFVVTYTGVHIIDDKSPIFNLSLAEMKEKKIEFFISIQGIDTESNELITGQHRYSFDSLMENKLFQDMMSMDANGNRSFDYTKLNQTY